MGGWGGGEGEFEECVCGRGRGGGGRQKVSLIPGVSVGSISLDPGRATKQSSGAVWKSRWAVLGFSRPNEAYGFCDVKQH